MYYLQVAITIALSIGIVVSLIYSLFLVYNLVKRRSSKCETMKKTFISIFCGWISIFIIVFLWQDKSDWSIRAWATFLILSISISFIVAFFAAVSFWSWKE